MTNQTLSVPVVDTKGFSAGTPPQTRSNSEISEHQMRLLEAMKKQYQLDQQEKFLNLQAEAESLLQQLQEIKQRKQASSN